MTVSSAPYALVVDDDPLILMNTASILQNAGFQALEAMDGDEALDLLTKHRHNIVLLFTDVDMPGTMNGFALARHVSATRPEIEIVMASGHVHPKDGEMPGKATFLFKPYSTYVVLSHLAQILPDNKKPGVFVRTF